MTPSSYSILGLSLLVLTTACGDPPASAQSQSPNTTTILTGPGGSRMTATSSPSTAALPAYVPAYPGATNMGGGVIAANSAQPGGITKTLINFTTPDSVDEVVKFYSAKLIANGVPVTVTPMSADMAMVTGDATAVEADNGLQSAAVSIAIVHEGATTTIGVSIDRQMATPN